LRTLLRKQPERISRERNNKQQTVTVFTSTLI